jgi:hypothetical protein
MSIEITQQEKSEAIRAVATGFFVALDRFEDERILELVAEEVEWVRPGGAVRGRAEVRDVLAQRSRERVTRHLLSNIDVALPNQNSALVRYDVLVFDSGASAPSGSPAMLAGPSVLLSGEDLLILRADRWQIVRKQATPVFKFNS